jgi:hypothetical protein
MGSSLRRWLHISLLNLLIVAFIGVILRYKIAFSLPFINQKYLLHGHSHFAFAGWITQVLMALLVQYLGQYKGEEVFKKYRWLLFGNCITAYGMLLFFPLQGYGFGSISFSTLSIINSYVFTIRYWKDLNAMTFKSTSHCWYKAALFFNVISSLGAFSLAYMMASKIMHQNWYLSAVYFFLHFQYNGWFFFAGMGLLVSKLEKVVSAAKQLKIIFWLFCLACVPAYFLSALWMPIPIFIYWLVIASAIAQFAGWMMFVKLIRKNKEVLKPYFSRRGRPLLLLSAIALTIKLLLQLGSTHPALSQLVFGFRPIVIGYLHLVLLSVITIFILGYIVTMNLLVTGKYFMVGVWVFISGIIVNEMLLMIQGVTGLNYIIVPFINEALFAAAIIMFSGILILNLNSAAENTLNSSKLKIVMALFKRTVEP